MGGTSGVEGRVVRADCRSGCSRVVPAAIVVSRADIFVPPYCATIFYKQIGGHFEGPMMADQNIMCEVEIQPDIQECVEIEAIPVDMHDSVETIVECGEPMIPMQSLEGRDIILEAQEEIIDDSGDPLNLYDVPVPDGSDIYIESSPGPSKRKKNSPQDYGFDNEIVLGDMHIESRPRKWEQKQVQIKTMEGEFSVTMWASGASDGTSRGGKQMLAAPPDPSWPRRDSLVLLLRVAIFPQGQFEGTRGDSRPIPDGSGGFDGVFRRVRGRFLAESRGKPRGLAAITSFLPFLLNGCICGRRHGRLRGFIS